MHGVKLVSTPPKNTNGSATQGREESIAVKSGASMATEYIPDHDERKFPVPERALRQCCNREKVSQAGRRRRATRPRCPSSRCVTHGGPEFVVTLTSPNTQFTAGANPAHLERHPIAAAQTTAYRNRMRFPIAR